MIVAPAMPKPSQRRGLRAAYAGSRKRRSPPHHRPGEAGRAPRARLRRLRRPPGAHRLRADAAERRRGLQHLPHALGRDDAGRASTRAASSRSSSAGSSRAHHHRREPLPRRPPHHRPRASARSTRTPATSQLRLARIIRIYDLGFWEETLLDTDRLFSAHHPQARVPAEDDHARAPLPARQGDRTASRRRSA